MTFGVKKSLRKKKQQLPESMLQGREARLSTPGICIGVLFLVRV
jgi:hypothetical protein